MQKVADITFQNTEFMLSGELDFANVMSVYQKSLRNLSDCANLTFDFSELKSSDSSGLALIIEWVKLAKQQRKPIHFKNLSKDLLSIASAAGLSNLISSGK